MIRSSFDFKTKVSLYFKTYDADEIISKLNKSAIGWFLTAESSINQYHFNKGKIMVELFEIEIYTKVEGDLILWYWKQLDNTASPQ